MDSGLATFGGVRSDQPAHMIGFMEPRCLNANQLKVRQNIFGQLRVSYPYFVVLKRALR